MKSRTVVFRSQGLTLSGILRYPNEPESRVPAVLLIHGSLEQDRDGNLLRHPAGREVPKKAFFLEIARQLTHIGCAVFSWDRRGFGESSGPKGALLTTLTDAKAALDALASQDDVVDPKRLVVLGQSAGVYTACLLAKEDPRPVAYIFQGGLYRDYSELMKFNYLPLKEFAEESFEKRAWVEKNNIWALAMALHLDQLEQASRGGKEELTIHYGNNSWTLRPEGLCYRPGYAPYELFRYVKMPVLILHGACDLTVPTEDAYDIEKELQKWGNRDVELRMIPGADHSFQEVAEEPEERLKEKISLASCRRPYREEYFSTLRDYIIRKVLKTIKSGSKEQRKADSLSDGV